MTKKDIKKRILRELQDEKTFEDVLRENTIKIAHHHKKYCDGKNCDISLALLRELLKGKYKIELIKEEEEIFI